MAEPAPTPPPPEPQEQPRESRPLVRIVQVLALTLVAGLLALLVWRVVHAGAGGRLVAEVRSGKKPAAPQFTLPVLWARAEIWPNEARGAAARRLGPRTRRQGRVPRHRRPGLQQRRAQVPEALRHAVRFRACRRRQERRLRGLRPD